MGAELPLTKLDYGVITIVAYFVIKELGRIVTYAINRVKGNGNGNGDFRVETKIDKMSRNIDDLWSWHNKEYPSGIKVWYTQPVMDSLNDLRESVEELTKELRKGGK